MVQSSNNKPSLYLIGASGHAKVIIDILDSKQLDVKALIDVNPAITSFLNYPVFRSLQDAGALSHDQLIISIGNNNIRKKLASEINDDAFINAIHTSAVVSRRSTIDKGTVVMSNVSINSGSVIGKHCILNTNCSVDHDCVLSDFVHISPNASLAGNVKVGEGTHIGIGACVIQNINIGQWVTIGAGAVIINDIPDYAVVVGNPGKILRISTNMEHV